MLVSPSRNPVRDQLYEAQIEYHNLPVKRRQLQKKLKEHTKGGQRYKQAYITKEISAKNRTLRTKYGKEHKDKTIHDFWQFLFFTDEAHIDPSSMAQGCILREQGHRYDTENIQERGEKTRVVDYPSVRYLDPQLGTGHPCTRTTRTSSVLYFLIRYLDPKVQ